MTRRVRKLILSALFAIGGVPAVQLQASGGCDCAGLQCCQCDSHCTNGSCIYNCGACAGIC